MAIDTQQARQFLARVLAWPQDGEQTAYVNIHNTFVPSGQTPKPGDKLPWTGRAARSLDEAIKAVDYASTQVAARDIYFCTSTQSFAQEKVSRRGFRYMAPVRNQQNAVKLKSLFIDIDLKDYKDHDELLTSLGNFLQATKLPRPTAIVSTGGGFHVYWTLMRALTPDEWRPLGFALAEATKREGLKCDSGCSIDTARVLRVPATKNYKYDPPRDVKLIGQMVEYDYSNEKIEAVLEPYKVSVPSSMSGALTGSILPAQAPLQGTSDLAAGIDSPTLQPVVLDSVVHECPFIDKALADGGKDYNNPLWNLTTLISTFTEGGRQDAHRMAMGHPDYSVESTNELFDRKNEEKARTNLGWPKCQTIASSGCSLCTSCKHLPEGKSPMNFGQRVTLQVTNLLTQMPINTVPGGPQGTGVSTAGGQQDPDLPTGYLRTPAGIVLYAQQLDDGSSTWLPVSKYPMSAPWMQDDPWSINFTTTTQVGKTTVIKVPTKDVETAELKKTLQEQGFMVQGRAHGLMIVSDFLMAWITKLQSVKNSVITSVPFGWLVRNGKTYGFVYGGVMHTPAGDEVASNTDPELGRQFSPTGEGDPWKVAAKMITDQGRPALDAILASSFGAPIVRFTGHQGLLMSAYSVESGIGKSTALKIAQAVWGDPIKAIQGLNDTQNSVFNKLGELKSLPIYWDELKSEDDTKRFVDLVFRLSGGKEKSRMRSNMTQRSPGMWQTIMVSGSNESILDVVSYKTRATTAGIYRVFEYTVTPAKPGSPGQIDPSDAQRIVSKLHDNFGVIGKSYAEFLGSQHAQVDSDMAAMLKTLNAELNANPDERFWIALIGAVLLGARYANQLGFTEINEPALKLFMLETLEAMRHERNRQPVDMKNVQNVVNTLARFLNEARARHTLVTNTIHRARGKPPTGAVTLEGDHSRLDAIHVHVGKNDRTIRIGQSYFYDWLTQHNYPRHVMVKALMEEMNAKQISARLGAGTSYANAAENIIEIDLAGTPLANFIDES